MKSFVLWHLTVLHSIIVLVSSVKHRICFTTVSLTNGGSHCQKCQDSLWVSTIKLCRPSSGFPMAWKNCYRIFFSLSKPGMSRNFGGKIAIEFFFFTFHAWNGKEFCNDYVISFKAIFYVFFFYYQELLYQENTYIVMGFTVIKVHESCSSNIANYDELAF